MPELRSIPKTAQWILHQYPETTITRDNASLVAVDIVNVVAARIGFPERRLMGAHGPAVVCPWVPWPSEVPFQDEVVTAVGRYIRDLNEE